MNINKNPKENVESNENRVAALKLSEQGVSWIIKNSAEEHSTELAPQNALQHVLQNIPKALRAQYDTAMSIFDGVWGQISENSGRFDVISAETPIKVCTQLNSSFVSDFL